ncbi:hypothetical protein HELRODRAFT_193864 [Helobdella robusta]|uniref:Protein-serine/threonine kinase n=1 Tax=Helobdella robusta TaxID=6412 RepID=T1FVF4_HELRO|nr:hypothetical protein HELRODRAFT_193864 [Helobdella robusta]ESN93999.1 hypothetical protein HELRODRAFT_193864 [Helobdella robusta]
MLKVASKLSVVSCSRSSNSASVLIVDSAGPCNKALSDVIEVLQGRWLSSSSGGPTQLKDKTNINNHRQQQAHETRPPDRSITYYYLQADIDSAAEKPQKPISLFKLLKSSFNKDHLIKNARFLQQELPIRVAKRVVAFHMLPFIVASNPSLLRCQELYTSSFQLLKSCEPVTNTSTEEQFSETIQEMLDYHKEVVSLLSQGFKEAGKYIEDKKLIATFLDDMMKSRLGMRLLCDHHLQIPIERVSYVGSIEMKFCVRALVERKARETKLQCERKYGSSPDVEVKGHMDATFMYISPPLDYVLNELLKNAMRAVMESKSRSSIKSLPPVIVTIVNNDTDFCIRISDRGDGIRHDIVDRIWQYGFTSVNHQLHERHDGGAFDIMSENRTAGIIYGFGLPVCRAFIEHLGGSLKLITMQGIVSEVPFPRCSTALLNEFFKRMVFEIRSVKFASGDGGVETCREKSQKSKRRFSTNCQQVIRNDYVLNYKYMQHDVVLLKCEFQSLLCETISPITAVRKVKKFAVSR